MTTTVLPINGMTCAGCVARVERALLNVPGVSGAAVNLATDRAEIESTGVSHQALIHAIEALGYEVPTQTTTLGIQGMTCASCAARVERALVAIPGVTAASVNLATEHATVTGTASVQELVSAIAASGYHAQQAPQLGMDTQAIDRRAAEAGSLRRDALIAAALAAPVVILEMGSHLVPALHRAIEHALGTQTSWGIQGVLTLAILLGPGRRFFAKGIPALARGAPDMNSLVSVGTAAAFGYSSVATLFPRLLPATAINVYFEAAAVIVALVLAGRYLEARAKGRTSDAIKRLAGLQPSVASVLRDGALVELPLAQVKRDDLVVVRPGERLATDGSVVSGRSYVDEAMITGEPVPQLKEAGALVTGGTINQSGSLTFRATAVGAQTVLSQIVRIVEQAQAAKLPIQARIDRITLWFVPAVLAAATATFFLWLLLGPPPAVTHALVNAVAVLIIACPCAMGLATPTSIMVGTGRAAELGVLFRRGDALQTLRAVQVVAFDKTGTLTEGRPRLTDLTVASGYDENDILAMVAAAESASEHPIAGAIVAAARERGVQLPDVSDFQAVPGMGVRASVNGRSLCIGTARFMREQGFDESRWQEQAAKQAREAKTTFHAAVEGEVVALLAVADPLKPTTSTAIDALHRLGMRVVMITGDNAATAQAVARRLGIDEVVSDVLPEGKMKAISELRARHGRVAYAGDGINDAPALAESDVGIAMGTGTDVAIESADVVLVAGDLRGVITAIGVSRATLRNIQQNLFWAFAYNVALIPIAAGLLYPINGMQMSPMIAAGAMAFSSVFVVSNALRLRRFQPGMILSGPPVKESAA